MLLDNFSFMTLPMFVPGDRPDRFGKAVAAGPDAVIIDLEDAVAPAAKATARSGLLQAMAVIAHDMPIVVRINAADTPWHADDLAACTGLPIHSIMLAKAETPADVERVGQFTGLPVIALVETARGLAASEQIATFAARLAFGSIDYAADLAMGHSRESLLSARSRLVLASRLAGIEAPLDGITTALHDAAVIATDCAHAVNLGFGGKLLVHPAQISPARQAFAPSADDIAWAKKVLGADQTKAVIRVDNLMVDAPVLARARQILARALPPNQPERGAT